jgi:Patatin-like phospholipase
MAPDPVHPRYCDLVMKGGITSGIVYPPAACTLANAYWFRNIGGASAGAIAAGATAAAEYGRRRGRGAQSYARLAGLPNEVAGKRLLQLFRPDPPTRALFRILMAVGRASGTAGGLRAAIQVLGGTAGWLWIALAGWIIGWTAALLDVAGQRPGTLLWILVASWCGAGVCLLLVGQCAMLARQFVRSVPANFYGLCTGSAAHPPDELPSLTGWLDALLNDLAGLPADRPLTFRDLWEAPQIDGDIINGEPVINLEVITTDLTRGRPCRVPSGLGTVYFSEAEWRRLFPEHVITWLKDHPDPRAGTRPPRSAIPGVGALLALPESADLPVVVAARLSLSFPLLISAVPLYAIDETLPDNRGESPIADRCWFSDGGISSNFPIQFFDAPLPRWPTFGMDLAPPRPDGDLTPWVAAPDTVDWREYWDRFNTSAVPTDLAGFLLAIFSTMQNWRDNLQVSMPGYWDRIVHIPIAPNEGGLHLTVDPATMSRMGQRGGEAANVLLDTFSWTNHAWVRYRSTMSALERLFNRFREAYLHPIPGDEKAWEVIQTPGGIAPSFPWDPQQAARAPQATRALVTLISHWAASRVRFQHGAPKPAPPDTAPELRITPKV